MSMKKIATLCATLLLVSGSMFAQLSTGEPHANVVPRTGNRPQAGDFGMYLGASVTQIIDLVKLNKNDNFGKNAFWALPAINLKYYFTDNWEGRIGFQFAAKGTTDTRKFKTTSTQPVASRTTARDIHYTRFLPGAAYHFNTNNILDVYVGAQMPIGFDIDNTRNSSETNGVKTKQTIDDSRFVIGGGVFLGLQLFVADLPFAIGVECGYSGQASIGGGKVTTTNNDGTKTKTIDGDPGKELKSSAYMEGVWGADAALTFTYYFQR